MYGQDYPDPAALIMLLLSFSPAVSGFIGNVPPVVIGSILLYILCSQIAGGLMVVFESQMNSNTSAA